MNEYRVTRPKLYPVGSFGHTDKGARQGHYIVAKDLQEAYDIASKHFPNEPLDIDIWKTNVKY